MRLKNKIVNKKISMASGIQLILSENLFDYQKKPNIIKKLSDKSSSDDSTQLIKIYLTKQMIRPITNYKI